MRVAVLVLVVAAACGSNHSGGSTDATGSGSGGDSGGGGGGDGASGGAHTVMLTLNNRPNNASQFGFAVAYQDGSGPWTLAPAPSGDTYALPINAPSYSVAWMCLGNLAANLQTQQRQVWVASFAIGERTSLTFDIPPRCTDRLPAPVALSGTVTNRIPGTTYLVSWGARTGIVGGNTGAFSLEVLPGTHDLFVLQLAPQGNQDFTVASAVVARGVAVTGATTHDVDWSTAAATQSFPVTVNAPQGARVAVTTTLYAGGSSPTLDRLTGLVYSSSALAASQGAAGDLYDQSILVGLNGQTAVVSNITAAPAAQTFAAPAPLGTATTTVPDKMPYPRIATSWAAYTDAIGYVWTASQQPTTQQCGGSACTITWTAVVSPGVLGSSPSFEMPDLSGLAGWNAGYQPISGLAATGNVTAMTSTLGAMDFPPGAAPTAATKRTFAASAYTVTP